VDTARRLVCPETPGDVLRSVRDALQGGPCVAPLPPEGLERAQALDVLRPEQPVAEAAAAAVVVTSGSTGRPKGVVLSRAAVVGAADATHERLGGPGHWILALPAHYVAGLMVLIRAAVAGAEVAVTDAWLRGLAEAAGRLEGRRYLSLVPTQLARACADPATTELLGSLDAVLIGGAAAEPSLLQRARACGIPVVVTYGMSETCGGCVYDGMPLDPMRVDLDSTTGRISLTGALVFSGYRLDPARTAEALHGSTFATQDRGRWVDGRLEVLGRLDAVVVSGGRNVDLQELERLAQTRIDSEVAVVGVPDAEWGSEVVVVSTGPETLAELRDRLAADVPAFALPRRLVRVTELPRTAGGKIDRRALVEQLQARAEVAAAAPNSSLQS
jgi:o-succinylbenzoate---CoA ligase